MAIPIVERKAQIIAEALIHRLITIFRPHCTLIVDKEQGFTSDVATATLTAL